MISNIDDNASDNGHYRARNIFEDASPYIGHRAFNPRVEKDLCPIYYGETTQDLKINPRTGRYDSKNTKRINIEELKRDVERAGNSKIMSGNKKKNKNARKSSRNQAEQKESQSFLDNIDLDPQEKQLNTTNVNNNRRNNNISRSR